MLLGCPEVVDLRASSSFRRDRFGKQWVSCKWRLPIYEIFSLVVDNVGAVGRVSVGHLPFGFRRSECSCRTNRLGSSGFPIYDIH